MTQTHLIMKSHDRDEWRRHCIIASSFISSIVSELGNKLKKIHSFVIQIVLVMTGLEPTTLITCHTTLYIYKSLSDLVKYVVITPICSRIDYNNNMF